MIKCVIIDDEPLARECITNYVAEVNFLQLEGTFGSVVDFLGIMDQRRVDLIFLDVEMPVINGIEFLRMRTNMPMVIITTAYPSYALEGFQLDVLDYLVKPITFNQFFKAVNKAKDYYQFFPANGSPAPRAADLDYFFIRCNHKYEKLYYDDVLYIQAMQNYVTIYTHKGKYITQLYLKNIEDKLDNKSFIRVHKSYIVSIPKIDAIDNNDIVIQDHRIPISRNYQAEVVGRVVNDKLWKK